MRPGWAAVACLLLAGCSSMSRVVDQMGRPDHYVVRPGDTLYSIAWRYRLDHEALMRWNDIADPRTLQPGVRLRLDPNAPPPAQPTAARQSPEPAVPERAARGDDASAPSPASGSSSAADGSAGDEPESWRWPTEGEVVTGFSEERATRRGLDIRGQAGQPVRATAAGEVVYSGSGLKAYGRLLIIRHAGDYLSAYGHNRDLLAAEGDRVDVGQIIARMGRANDGDALLHFEIRRGGEPVDPMTYLPARP